MSIKEEPKKIIIKPNVHTYKLTNMHTKYNITLTIDFDKKKISGQSVINEYFADINVKDDLIEIKPIKTTRKTDNDEKRKAEGQYLSVLQTAHSFKVENDKLYIYTIFLADTPLIFKLIS